MIGTLTMPPVEAWVQGFGFVVASTAVGWWTSGGAVDRWKGSWRGRAIFPTLMALWSTVLVVRFGCTVAAMAGALYGVLALYASYADLQSREVDDFIHLMLLLVGLLGTQVQQVPAMALAGGGGSLPMLLVGLGFPCPLGGADGEDNAALAFGAGGGGAMWGLMAGLALAPVHQFIKKTKGEGFPLIPYLSTGFLLSYILVGGV